jgi:hypothetical protein
MLSKPGVVSGHLSPAVPSENLHCSQVSLAQARVGLFCRHFGHLLLDLFPHYKQDISSRFWMAHNMMGK